MSDSLISNPGYMFTGTATDKNNNSYFPYTSCANFFSTGMERSTFSVSMQ